ncbi:MAG: ABC transporter permease [Rhizobiaceae bacterium]|nr:ABC transporter permease [Rhizobiaceae bacterium]
MARQGRSIFALTVPTFLWLTVAVVLPITVMFYFSFLSASPFGTKPASLTLDNYATFFTKDFYSFLAWRSIKLGLLVAALCALIGFPAALVLSHRLSGYWREALLLLVILPFWSNALIRIFAWTMVLREQGLVDQAVHAVLPWAPSVGILYSYPAIVIGLVHSFLPYMILTCYISLQAIDPSLVDAARGLGARDHTILRRIILPLSFPGLAVGAILTFVPVVGAFMEPRILGGRQGITMGTVIEDQFTEVFNWPLGAALSFILLGIVLAILALCYPLLRARFRLG